MTLPATAMKPLSLTLQLLATLLLLSACKKESPGEEGLKYIGGLPYYCFTPTDQLWLQAKTGDVWTFENGQGVRRSSRASVIEHLQAEYKTFAPSGLLGTKYTLVSYYDEATLSLISSDTSRMSFNGQIQFYRDATTTAYNTVGAGPSRFYVGGEWYRFIGNTDEHSDYYSCHGLKFPSAAQLNGPFASLTVRGKVYTDVVLLAATRRAQTCALPTPSSITDLYYDRQAGVVRMVSLAGEVWDRVP